MVHDFYLEFCVQRWQWTGSISAQAGQYFLFA